MTVIPLRRALLPARLHSSARKSVREIASLAFLFKVKFTYPEILTHRSPMKLDHFRQTIRRPILGSTTACKSKCRSL